MNKGFEESLRVSGELLLYFFVVFSRFEYALKQHGFVKTGRGGEAQPNWDKLTSMLKTESEATIAPILKLGQYMLDRPPKKQVLRNGALEWEDVAPPRKKDLEFLIQGVKRVRNNLFHGGKFSTIDIYMESRNERLIQCSLNVLMAILQLPSAYKLNHLFNHGG